MPKKNALEVLRCVRAVQHYFCSGKPVYETKNGIQYAPKFIDRETIPERFPDGFTPALLERQLRETMSTLVLEVMMLTIAFMKCDYHEFVGPKAETGKKFIHRKPRPHPLREIIAAIIAEVHDRKLRPEDVWKRLEQKFNAGDLSDVIDAIDSEKAEIRWHNRNKKHVSALGWKSFRNLVSTAKPTHTPVP